MPPKGKCDETLPRKFCEWFARRHFATATPIPKKQVFTDFMEYFRTTSTNGPQEKRYLTRKNKFREAVLPVVVNSNLDPMMKAKVFFVTSSPISEELLAILHKEKFEIELDRHNRINSLAFNGRTLFSGTHLSRVYESTEKPIPSSTADDNESDIEIMDYDAEISLGPVQPGASSPPSITQVQVLPKMEYPPFPFPNFQVMPKQEVVEPEDSEVHPQAPMPSNHFVPPFGAPIVYGNVPINYPGVAHNCPTTSAPIVVKVNPEPVYRRKRSMGEIINDVIKNVPLAQATVVDFAPRSENVAAIFKLIDSVLDRLFLQANMTTNIFADTQLQAINLSTLSSPNMKLSAFDIMSKINVELSSWVNGNPHVMRTPFRIRQVWKTIKFCLIENDNILRTALMPMVDEMIVNMGDDKLVDCSLILHTFNRIIDDLHAKSQNS